MLLVLKILSEKNPVTTLTFCLLSMRLHDLESSSNSFLLVRRKRKRLARKTHTLETYETLTKL